MLPLSYGFLKRQCGGKRRKMVPNQVFRGRLTDIPADCCHKMLKNREIWSRQAKNARKSRFKSKTGYPGFGHF
jgi:hypothetical protein